MKQKKAVAPATGLFVGYVCVSTDIQAGHDVQLEAQTKKARALAVIHDTEPVEVIVDGGESASSPERPDSEATGSGLDTRIRNCATAS